MRRALRGAVGTLLVSGIVGLMRPALAQPPYTLTEQPTPMRKVPHEGKAVVADGNNRLDEMKVELALLADTATFPYYLSSRVAGANLEVRGYVPNAMVRQRVLDIARRTTTLRVVDGLELLARPRVHPPAPRLEVLQQ